MPRRGIAGSSGSTMSNFLRNRHTDFQSGCTSLQSHEQCRSVPLSPHPCQHLLSSEFLILAILTGVRWNLRVVLICISLMIKDVEHFFQVLLSHSVFLRWKFFLNLLGAFLSYWQCLLPYRSFAILWGPICLFLILAILICVRLNLRVVLICISLMIKDVVLFSGDSQWFGILPLRIRCLGMCHIFYWGYLIPLEFHCLSSLYILDMRPYPRFRIGKDAFPIC